jgi:hypothetical protein
MVVGVAATVLGVVVFINSASTDVSQRTGGGHGDAQATSPRLDAYLRTPTWRTATSSTEGMNPAPAAAFPVLFTGRF